MPEGVESAENFMSGRREQLAVAIMKATGIIAGSFLTSYSRLKGYPPDLRYMTIAGLFGMHWTLCNIPQVRYSKVGSYFLDGFHSLLLGAMLTEAGTLALIHSGIPPRIIPAPAPLEPELISV